MARTVKDKEERRLEFIETSQQMFIENGYYATSVDDIVNKMGVAKGLFYYYFKSKEDLVYQIVDRLWDGAVEDYVKIRDMEGINALEKLMLYSQARGEVKLQQSYLVELVIKEPHSPLVQQMKDRGFEMLTPILGEIISQGVEEGVFDTEYPYEAAAFLVHGAEGLISTDISDPDALVRVYMITLDLWERVLGTEKGTFMTLLDEHEENLRKFSKAAERVELDNVSSDEEGDD